MGGGVYERYRTPTELTPQSHPCGVSIVALKTHPNGPSSKQKTFKTPSSQTSVSDKEVSRWWQPFSAGWGGVNKISKDNRPTNIALGREIGTQLFDQSYAFLYCIYVLSCAVLPLRSTNRNTSTSVHSTMSLTCLAADLSVLLAPTVCQCRRLS